MTDHIVVFVLGILASLAGGFLLKLSQEKFLGRVTFNTILKAIDSLLIAFHKGRFQPDFVVGVGRNGAIEASILSSHLGTRAILTATVRSQWTKDGNREEVLETSYMQTHDSLCDKNILLVTCFINTGAAMKAVYNHYSSLPQESAPAVIKKATVFTAVDPVSKPDFFVYEVGENYHLPMHKIMRSLPWMRKSWIFSLDIEASNPDCI